MKSFTLCALLLLLTACAVRQHPAAGQPPEYQTGYSDGCSSGYVAAGHPYYRFTKDTSRYGSAPLYKQGWDDGQMTCKGEYEAIGRAMQR